MSRITIAAQAGPDSYYTYRDYKEWPEDARYELINGVPYMMSSPGEWHQNLLGELYTQLRVFLRGKTCRVYMAPFDVRDDDSDDTVVQPDLMVICNREKLSDGKSCRGAPDFIAGIVSGSTRRRDFLTKKEKYLKAGVREYWIIERNSVYKNLLVTGSACEVFYEETVYPYPCFENFSTNEDFSDAIGGSDFSLEVSILSPFSLRF